MQEKNKLWRSILHDKPLQIKGYLLRKLIL